MPSYVVRNQNFRDEVLKYSYPFDEQSLLEDDELYIGTDLFIDAVFYLKEAAELPLYIAVIDGTYGEIEEAQVLIAEAGGTVVGRAALNYDSDTVTVTGTRGFPVGALVLNHDGLQRFLGKVAGKVFNLLPDVASFCLDTSHVSAVNHLRYVAYGEAAARGNVRIVARHGVRFSVTAEGAIALDVLGESAGTGDRRPIRSINGVRNRSIWLNGHPRSNLRISTEDGQLSFVAAGDDTQ